MRAKREKESEKERERKRVHVEGPWQACIKLLIIYKNYNIITKVRIFNVLDLLKKVAIIFECFKIRTHQHKHVKIKAS